MSPIAVPDLEQHLKAIGNALILAGDPTTLGGMSILGLKEGEATVEWNEEYRDLTAPEQSGPGIHERQIIGQNPVVSLPMIIGDPALYATLAPTGSKGGGYYKAQDVVTTTLALVPEAEFGESFGYDGTAWTPEAPEHALWFWRGHFQTPGFTFRVDEMGKRVETVQFVAMFAKSTDPALTIAEGIRQWAVGDPVAQGVTDLLI